MHPHRMTAQQRVGPLVAIGRFAALGTGVLVTLALTYPYDVGTALAAGIVVALAGWVLTAAVAFGYLCVLRLRSLRRWLRGEYLCHCRRCQP